MKSNKKLLAIYEKARPKKEEFYYTFEDFKNDARQFLKDIKNEDVVAAVKVSRSGMTRRFNLKCYNMFLNVCHNQKFSWDEVKVGGCGMDMWWHLLFSVCERIETKGNIEKHKLNFKCSHQILL